MGKKPAAEEIEKRKLVLRHRGVPEAFADNIAGRRSSLTTSGVLSIVPLLAAIGLFWVLLDLLFAHMWNAAKQSSVLDDAWFHRLATGNAMPWILALMLAAVLASGWAYSRMIEHVRPCPEPNAAAAALQMASSDITGRFVDWFLRRSVSAATRGCDSAECFLAAIARNHTNVWRNATLIVAVPSALGLAMTYRDHITVGPDGIMRHSLLSTEQHSWHEISRLELGCNHTRDFESLIYEVHFGAWSLDLAYHEGNGFGPAKIQPSQILQDIERVDAVLAESTPRVRWSWLGRDPLAPSCLTFWSQTGGDNGLKRLTRLLRTD